MNFSKILRIVLAAILTISISAHTKRTPEEMVQYRRHIARNAQLLNACLETPELKQLSTRIQAKRQESLHHIRKARGINVVPRDRPSFDKWNAIPHDKTKDGKGLNPTNDESLFGYKKSDNVPSSSCILTPEITFGPFFADHEALRQDIRAGQPGIYQRLALQVIDISSCKPLKGARVDIWQTNATGWYAKDVRDSHRDGAAHWLTGAQRTTDWGVVDFDTVFPGHYAGRCVHTHVAVRPGDRFNNGDGFVHAGQIFFDDKVREVVDGYAPYTENKNKVVLNKDDYYGPGVASKEYDPFAQWAWLDEGVHQAGLVSWITIGVDTSYHRDLW